VTLLDYAPHEPRPGLMKPISEAVGTLCFLCGLPALVFFILAWPGH